MELPLAEVVLSPRLHLRKGLRQERRPFSFAEAKGTTGIRAPLGDGRGKPPLRRAQRLRRGATPRGRVRYLVNGARAATEEV